MGFAAPFAPRRLRRDAELVAPSLPSQKKQKAAEAAKKSGNKQRFPKGKKTLDIADWLTQMEYAAASARGLARARAKRVLGERRRAARDPPFPSPSPLDEFRSFRANQVLDGDKVLRSGHTYAKEKFQSKDQFDKAKGRDTGNAPAKKGGLPGFLNW